MLTKFKNLFSFLFLHSFRRTFSILGFLMLASGIPLTLLLLKQQQDIRQEASSTAFYKLYDGYECYNGAVQLPNYSSGQKQYQIVEPCFSKSCTSNGTSVYCAAKKLETASRPKGNVETQLFAKREGYICKENDIFALKPKSQYDLEGFFGACQANKSCVEDENGYFVYCTKNLGTAEEEKLYEDDYEALNLPAAAPKINPELVKSITDDAQQNYSNLMAEAEKEIVDKTRELMVDKIGEELLKKGVSETNVTNARVALFAAITVNNVNSADEYKDAFSKAFLTYPSLKTIEGQKDLVLLVTENSYKSIRSNASSIVTETVKTAVLAEARNRLIQAGVSSVMVDSIASSLGLVLVAKTVYDVFQILEDYSIGNIYLKYSCNPRPDLNHDEITVRKYRISGKYGVDWADQKMSCPENTRCFRYNDLKQSTYCATKDLSWKNTETHATDLKSCAEVHGSGNFSCRQSSECLSPNRALSSVGTVCSEFSGAVCCDISSPTPTRAPAKTCENTYGSKFHCETDIYRCTSGNTAAAAGLDCSSSGPTAYCCGEDSTPACKYGTTPEGICAPAPPVAGGGGGTIGVRPAQPLQTNTLTGCENGSVYTQFEWQQVSGVTYDLYYGANGSSPTLQKSNVTSPLKISGFTPGINVSWQVWARNSVGSSPSANGPWSYTTSSCSSSGTAGPPVLKTPTTVCSGGLVQIGFNFTSGTGATSHTLRYGAPKFENNTQEIKNYTSGTSIKGFSKNTDIEWQVYSVDDNSAETPSTNGTHIERTPSVCEVLTSSKEEQISYESQETIANGTKLRGEQCQTDSECRSGLFCRSGIVSGISICEDYASDTCMPSGSRCGTGGAFTEMGCCPGLICDGAVCTTPPNCTGCSIQLGSQCYDRNDRCAPGNICKRGDCILEPTPIPTKQAEVQSSTCPSNGIRTITYNRTGCFNSREAKSASVTCNDGTRKTLSSTFSCISADRFQKEASNFCSSHKTCTTPIQTKTDNLSCDPVKDGVVDEKDLILLKDEWFKVKSTQISDCFVKDGKVDVLDYNMWRDISVLKKKAPF